ncbi:MAG TPA: PIG-L family deacetylase [Verrucomicrobiales bacterium]|nr:PIG-L family deacetylase [Verrucomicrobiales bacterium]
MKFTQPTAELFIPDGMPADQALARTTHLAVGAHQDDLEFMALHGILECYQKPDLWFTGVTVTDGRGSSRIHEYAGYTDDQMQAARKHEQRKAAFVGEYAAMAQLDFPSAGVKTAGFRPVVEDLRRILESMRPKVIYTHNLADKHDTHIGVVVALIEALRELPPGRHPEKLYGCEVWRNLDWMVDEEKVLLDASPRENLSAALMGIFDSQISGGKRYDLATIGRKRANATYLASHHSDNARMLEYAMDLTPLIRDPKSDPVALVERHLQRFAKDVTERIRRRL